MHPMNDIVDYLLEKGRKINGCGITNVDINKIIYLAQGWHLALVREPLFSEEIEAWTYGPVVPAVYARLAKYEDQPIPRSEARPGAKRRLPEPIRHLLDQVWAKYSHLSPGELIALTHEPDGPWKIARGELADKERSSARLSQADMQAYFTDERRRSKVERNRPNQNALSHWEAAAHG